jgi:hypothetical protein
MSISIPEDKTLATDVRLSQDTLTIELQDGRSISAPLTWYPRLQHATPDERKNWQLIGEGEGIRSGESQESFQKWLTSRPERSI